MKMWQRINPNFIAVMHDTFVAGLSFLMALYLRGGTKLFAQMGASVWLAMGAFAIITMAVIVTMRCYRGLWRYASMQDLITLTKAATLSVAIFYCGFFLITRLEGLPRSVPVIHWLALLAMLGGPRFAYRMVKDQLLGQRAHTGDDSRIPVLLVGANERGEHFLRETQRSKNAAYRVIGILDENPRFSDKLMHGVKIYGSIMSLPKVYSKLKRRGDAPQRVIVTEALSGDAMRDLFDMSNRIGMTLSRLPKLTEFKTGMAETQETKPIDVEDLLGRSQNTHDKKHLEKIAKGKRILITGAGGTIGAELVRQIASCEPAAIYLLELGEYNLYEIDMELANQFSDIPREAILGDIRDADHMEHIFATFKPEIVFHAAAIKHVPLAEINAAEALLTNVFGTRNIADCCAKHKTEAMVLISTDKAVNPANVMGASKRLAEIYVQALSQKATKTDFITVRFGNVLGSTGSVVPLFQKQLAAGGPITITHPDMVRYFMTVREAVELVLHAASMGTDEQDEQRGLIYVVDMGQPVRIEQLASQMIRLAGLEPHRDIKIKYTGLRPGEKLQEELFYTSESTLKTNHEGILLAASNHITLKHIHTPMNQLLNACLAREDGLHALLKTLVPEFTSDTSLENIK